MRRGVLRFAEDPFRTDPFGKRLQDAWRGRGFRGDLDAERGFFHDLDRNIAGSRRLFFGPTQSQGTVPSSYAPAPQMTAPAAVPSVTRVLRPDQALGEWLRARAEAPVAPDPNAPVRLADGRVVARHFAELRGLLPPPAPETALAPVRARWDAVESAPALQPSLSPASAFAAPGLQAAGGPAGINVTFSGPMYFNGASFEQLARQVGQMAEQRFRQQFRQWFYEERDAETRRAFPGPSGY